MTNEVETFQAGDRVKLINARSWWVNLVGTVKITDDWNREPADVRVYVRWRAGEQAQSYAASELVKVTD